MSNLYNILDDLYEYGYSCGHGGLENGEQRIVEARQKAKILMLDLIGPDETRPQEGPQRNGVAQGLRRARNKLRVELRQKVQEL
jgi:hypothetical protein